MIKFTYKVHCYFPHREGRYSETHCLLRFYHATTHWCHFPSLLKFVDPALRRSDSSSKLLINTSSKFILVFIFRKIIYAMYKVVNINISKEFKWYQKLLSFTWLACLFINKLNTVKFSTIFQPCKHWKKWHLI